MLINLDDRKPEFDFSSDVYITLSPQVYQSLNTWVKHFTTEISGCGMVTKITNEDKSVQYIVDEIFLPNEQKNTYSSTDIDTDMVHKLMTDLLKANKDTSRLKLHWHSHANMNVFHSGTDKDNYKDLNNGDYLISLVLNKDGDILGGLHLYGEYRLDIKGVPVYVHIPTPATDVLTEKAIKELEAFTKKNEKVFNGYDWDRERKKWDSKFEFDLVKQCYVPIKNKKKEIKLLELTTDKRKEALGDKFNAIFEYCDGTKGGEYKCRQCENEIECTKYWTENW